MADDSTRLAVLIDADNTPSRLLKEMFEELAGYGTITVKRAYGDWTNPHLNNWREVLLANAISPQQQFAYTYGKNATDSALIIDAMDLLYSGNVDGFAIVSSDSDFTPLATRLRESGKRVIGVGQRKTPKAFVEACERFVFLEVLAGDSGASGGASGGASDGTGSDGDAGRAAAEPAKQEHAPPIRSVLTKSLNKVDTDDDDWARLSDLGNHLNRTDPSFDSRTYGFGKLSDLVKAQTYLETRTVTGAGGHGQLLVRLKGRRPAAEPSSEKPVKRAASTAKGAAAKSATATSATAKSAPAKSAPAKSAPAKSAAAPTTKATTKKTARKATRPAS